MNFALNCLSLGLLTDRAPFVSSKFVEFSISQTSVRKSFSSFLYTTSFRSVFLTNCLMKRFLTSSLEIMQNYYVSQTLSCQSTIKVSYGRFEDCSRSNGGGGGFICRCSTSVLIVENCDFLRCSALGSFTLGSRPDCCGGGFAAECSSANISKSTFVSCFGVGTAPTFYIYCPFSSNVFIENIHQAFCGKGGEYDSWCVDLPNTTVKCINLSNILFTGGWAAGHAGYSSRWASFLYVDVRNSKANNIVGNSIHSSSPPTIIKNSNFVNHTSKGIIWISHESHYQNCIFYLCYGSLVENLASPPSYLVFKSCIIDSKYSTLSLNTQSCTFPTDLDLNQISVYCTDIMIINTNAIRVGNRPIPIMLLILLLL